MSRIWYSYVGPTGGELTAGNYLPTDVKPSCLQGSSNICAIYARTDPQRYGVTPIPFSLNLIRYIANAKSTTLAQPLGLTVKKYLYTQPAP
jgi:hypothetical protein